jgi:chemotaxis response regulator CheB
MIQWYSGRSCPRLSTDSRIEVVRRRQSLRGRDKILETNPDIITCDIECPDE